jgi:hypothetical protein
VLLLGLGGVGGRCCLGKSASTAASWRISTLVGVPRALAHAGVIPSARAGVVEREADFLGQLLVLLVVVLAVVITGVLVPAVAVLPGSTREAQLEMIRDSVAELLELESPRLPATPLSAEPTLGRGRRRRDGHWSKPVGPVRGCELFGGLRVFVIERMFYCVGEAG